MIFLTGVVDIVGFAARLLRKKHREGVRMAVNGPAALLQRLDQSLWVQEQLDFIPHVWLRPGAALPTATMQARTLLWLLASPEPALRCDSAVNLGCDGLDLATSHARVAEVIGTNADEVSAGRARWKSYEAQGHALSHKPQR